MKTKDIIIRRKNGTLKSRKQHYYNGNIQSEYYCNTYGNFHRLNKPAITEWHINGCIRYLGYRVYGFIFNLNNPANILYKENGKIDSKDYCFRYIRPKIIWQNIIKKI